MKKTFLVIVLAAFPSASAVAADRVLDCVAEHVCVARVDSVCDRIEVVYSLEVPREAGDKVVLTTEEGERFYEFRRLDDAAGVLLQAAGGALDDDQGAGAMTIFDDLGFVLTRHARIDAAEGAAPGDPVAISIHGRCAPRE